MSIMSSRSRSEHLCPTHRLRTTRLFASLAAAALLLVLTAPAASAYSGGGQPGPFPVPGAERANIQAFPIQLADGNPRRVGIEMRRLHAMTVHGKSVAVGRLIVSENYHSFSISVPRDVAERMERATLEVWAPRNKPLVVLHDHLGTEPETIRARLVTPMRFNDHGEALWTFETKTFSAFALGEPLADDVDEEPLVLFILLLVAGAGSSYWRFRDDAT